MKIVTIVGARPQFIKAAIVSRQMRLSGGIRELLVHTGQHYSDQMSGVFFRELELSEPDYNLGIGSAHHGVQTGRMLEAVERVLLREVPDRVVLYGDTNSTLAGALAAAKLHIPVAHIEAGLRSFNRRMPEEINRILTDHVSDLLFAPTAAAVQNLKNEGFSTAKIHLVGDVMYDAAVYYGGRLLETGGVAHDRLGLTHGDYALATVHRAENTDDTDRLKAIIEGLGEVAKVMPVILPLHPRTRNALERSGLSATAEERLRVIEPLSYLNMVQLERHAAVIATDSGGVQKEAYFHGVPCVTLRDETEWTELVASGWNQVVPPDDPEAIRHAIMGAVGTKGKDVELYGGGRAAERILEVLKRS